MAKRTRNILKSYFQDGKNPNQSNFEDLIDSQLNLNDPNPQIIEGVISASGVHATLSLEALSLREVAKLSFTGSNEFGSQSAALSSGVTSHSFFGPIYQSSSGADSASYFLTPVNFGTTESPMKNGGIFIQKELGLGAEGALQNQLSQSISASLLISGGYSHLAFDSNEIDLWGDNLYIKAYSTASDKGNIVFQTGELDTSFDTRMTIKKDGTVDVKDILSINNTPLLNLANNNTTRGSFNPIAAAIRNSGKCLLLDTDFTDGENGISPKYGIENHGHVKRMLWTHESASAFNSDWGVKTESIDSNTDTIYYKGWSSSSIFDEVFDSNISTGDFSRGVPNSSGYVIEVKYDGTAVDDTDLHRGLGGFYTFNTDFQQYQMNHTYVRVFKACLSSSYEFIVDDRDENINRGTYGYDNDTSYWLTSNKGTDKWEWYIHVSHIGDEIIRNANGTLITPGMSHIFVQNIEGSLDYATEYKYYLASYTVYDMTEADAFTHRRIGIGTNNPTNPLHVNTGSLIGDMGSQNYNNTPVKIEDSSAIMYIGGNSINTNDNSYINTDGDYDLYFGTNNTERLRIKPNGDIIFHQGDGITFKNPTSAEQTIEFNTDRLRFWTDGNERLTILSSSGYVGINTSTPDSILEVVDSNPTLTISNTTDSSGGTPTLRLAESDGTALGNYYDLKLVPGGNFTINDQWGSNTGDRLIINKDGYIGIGTSPDTSHKLKVDGTILADRFLGIADLQQIFLDDNNKLLMGNTEDDPNFQIYSSYRNSIINHKAASGDLIISNKFGSINITRGYNNLLTFNENGDDHIRAYSTILLEDALVLGDSGDFQIYRDNNNNTVLRQSGTGDIIITNLDDDHLISLKIEDEVFLNVGDSKIDFKKPIEIPDLEETGSYASNLVVDGNGQIKKSTVPNIIPLGTIMMWTGTTAPPGWRFCQSGQTSANGVVIPNLVDKFIKSSNAAGSNIGHTGGSNSVTLTANNIPYISSTIETTTNLNGNIGGISETFNRDANPDSEYEENGTRNRMWKEGGYESDHTPSSVTDGNGGAIFYNFNHSHTFDLGNASPTAIDTVPEHYTLRFIIYVGA
jgi:hypothetical protein